MEHWLGVLEVPELESARRPYHKLVEVPMHQLRNAQCCPALAQSTSVIMAKLS